ncbi:helix-turn-helix domain-containing protein [Adlercreutzia muris]|uniref:helix-turn-helix domain-containing protein n=1 Tax=Adlercreutzia muris TaxID=1796610 RepID=UPI003B969E3B
MEIMRALMAARPSRNLAQKELAARTGIARAEISRIENGARNPSVKVLQKRADGMGTAPHISFTPKEQRASAFKRHRAQETCFHIGCGREPLRPGKENRIASRFFFPRAQDCRPRRGFPSSFRLHSAPRMEVPTRANR